MTRQNLLITGLTAWVVTSYITFCLVAVNIGFRADFVWLWLRSWLIAWGWLSRRCCLSARLSDEN